ncbi:hypothetical protein RGQ29_014064 [Quercus rubra]|uniref:Germin-like protein n=1 Tax=Quercus rubra TaxID=3512 RepID=A0AAN7J2N9_QUERU|nr:hypothetical protein RGQ29_014064 [Quercus rubra]
MASKTFSMIFFSLLVFSFSIIQMAIAGDPDILSDFMVPANVTTVDGSFFTFTSIRTLVRSSPPTNTTTFTAWKASKAEFSALNGQSISIDVLYFPPGSINPPHTRVRTLEVGDIFVFPKGLVRYQYNPDSQTPALAIAAFGSSNPESVSIPNAVFNTGIDDIVSADVGEIIEYFDVTTIQALKAGLAPKP